MKLITDSLSLDPNADEPAIVTAIEKLKGDLVDALSARTGVPKGTDLKALKAKLEAGLTKEQALEVLANQAAADKAADEATEKPKKGK